MLWCYVVVKRSRRKPRLSVPIPFSLLHHSMFKAKQYKLNTNNINKQYHSILKRFSSSKQKYKHNNQNNFNKHNSIFIFWTTI